MLNRRATRMYKARMIPFKRLNEIRTRKRAELANERSGNRPANEMTNSNMTEVVRKEPKMAESEPRPVTQAQYSPRIQTIKRNPSVGEHSTGMTHSGLPVNHHSPTHIRSTTMTPTNQPPHGAPMSKPPPKMSQDGRNYVNVGAPISIGIPPSGNLSHQTSDQPKMTKQNWIMKQKTTQPTHPSAHGHGGGHSGGHGAPSGGQSGPPKSTVLHVQRRESVQSPRKSSNHPQNQSIKVQVPKSAYIIQNKHISSTKNEKGRLVLQSTGANHGQAFGGKQTVMLQTPNKQITTNTIRYAYLL